MLSNYSRKRYIISAFVYSHNFYPSKYSYITKQNRFKLFSCKNMKNYFDSFSSVSKTSKTTRFHPKLI